MCNNSENSRWTVTGWSSLGWIKLTLLTAILLRLLDGRVSLTSSTLGSGDGQTCTRMSWSKSSIASTLSTWKPTRSVWIPTITSESSVLASTWRDFLYRSVHPHVGNSGSTHHANFLLARIERRNTFSFYSLLVTTKSVIRVAGLSLPARDDKIKIFWQNSHQWVRTKRKISNAGFCNAICRWLSHMPVVGIACDFQYNLQKWMEDSYAKSPSYYIQETLNTLFQKFLFVRK